MRVVVAQRGALMNFGILSGSLVDLHECLASHIASEILIADRLEVSSFCGRL
jgi:hypothetical protein